MNLFTQIEMCGHSVCISLYYNAFSHIFLFSPPSIVPSLFIRNYFVVSEMCQTVFTRSVHSSSYYFSPVGQILWPSSCTVCHENNCALHKFSVKKTFFCLLFFQRVPIQVCCITIFDTHFRWYSFKFIMTETIHKRYCWNDTWPRYWQSRFWLWPIWQWFFWYCHMTKWPVTPHKRLYMQCQKTKQMEGDA